MTRISPGPWPKFRGDAPQTGRAQGEVHRRAAAGWTWPAKAAHSAGPGRAARGIFNSAVVDAQGMVYSGDAAGRLSRVPGSSGDGTVLAEVDVLIDTTPLIVEGALYVSCGDGTIRRWTPDGGLKEWFHAPAAVPPAFINWFEGHLGADKNGNIIAPNDNFHVYLLDPRTAEVVKAFQMHDQTWSLACVDPRNGNLYFGNNAMLALDPEARNVFAFSAGGDLLWSYATKGSVVASPAYHNGWIYAGSFDGYLYAFDTADGTRPKWTFATGDHLYASPAILSDGTVVQASCDGCVYALEPGTGKLKWRYDMPLRQPFRSSPAVDAADRVWLGTGDGRVLVLDNGGKALALHPLRIAGPRRQVNASPALCADGVVIGDSEGALHLVPWSAADDAAAVPAHEEPGERAIPVVARLSPTDPWGVLAEQLPSSLRVGEPLCFTIDAHSFDSALRRKRIIALIDNVEVWPPEKWQARLSGDRRYVIVEQRAGFTPAMTEPLRLRTHWSYDPQKRDGLKMSGGIPGPAFDTELNLHVQGMPALRNEPPPMVWYQRIAMSLPALLPSYNQIGFETLVYGITRVCALRDGEWLYLCTGWTAQGLPDANTGVRFPMVGRWDATTGTLRLRGENIHSELNGFPTRMRDFALTCWFAANGQPSGDPILRITYTPSGVGFYGRMLEALGMGTNDEPIEVFGSGALGIWPAPGTPIGDLHWTLEANGNAIRVHCGPGAHLEHSLLALVVQEPGGEPVTMDYAAATERVASDQGVVLRLLHRSHPATPWTAKHKVWLVANGEARAVPYRA